MRKLAILVLALPFLAFGQVVNPTTNLIQQSGIPVFLAPNGTIATNGTVTLGTALPTTYPYVWFYFPAGAVSGGSAGVYYATCTSTTVCQVYTNFVNTATTAFSPTVPASPVAATGSNAAYTQTTSTYLTLINTTITAGVMGTNGSIRDTATWVMNGSTNTRAWGVNLGGSGTYNVATSTSSASVTSNRGQVEIHNVGDASHQSSFGSVQTPFSATSAALLYGTVNTANTQALNVACFIATATDYCGVIQNTVELFR